MDQDKTVQKIGKICMAISKLSEKEFDAVMELVNRQIGYSHPLKMRTSIKINELGHSNREVVLYLKKIKEEVKKQKEIKRRKIQKF